MKISGIRITLKYLSPWPLLAMLCAQSISFSPELTYHYESDSEEYSIENIPIRDYELTILGQYKSNKLNILARFGYHLLDGTKIAAFHPIGLSDFTHTQGLHWVEHPPGIADDQSNYYIADMKLTFGDSLSYFYLNKWDKYWGPGVNSLIISTKAPNFFHFGFKWKINKNIHFEYFHGKLMSGITDSNYMELYENRTIDIARNLVAHRLEWQPYQGVIISGSELVTYANRLIEMAYLVPFSPFFPIQTYIGETDNVIISGDIQFLLNDNFRFYGVLLIDDWSPPSTFQINNNNKFGWQAGIDWNNIYLKNDRLRLEYSWTDHRIFHHKYKVNDYYSFDYPVGFWAGPHAEEIYMDYSFTLGKNQVQLLFSNAKRGEFTDSIRVYQSGQPSVEIPMYERFSGKNENKIIIKMYLSRKINERFNFSINYTYVDWKNGNNMFNSRETGELIIENSTDLIKNSLGFGLQYHY